MKMTPEGMTHSQWRKLARLKRIAKGRRAKKLQRAEEEKAAYNERREENLRQNKGFTKPAEGTRASRRRKRKGSE